MQVIENAVRMMKAPAGEGGRDRAEPVFPDTPEAEARADDVPVMPTLRRRRQEPLFAEEDASAQEPEELVAPVRAPRKPRKKAAPAAAAGGKPQFGPILRGFGAVASIALVLGVSVWTYKLGQRDAMDVPIIAAMEGPARIAPKDPGGAEMAHKGLSVNGVLEGGGVAPVAREVVVAPTGDALAEEDAAQGELAAILAARKPTHRPTEEEALLDGNLAAVMIIQEMEPEPDAEAAPAGAEIPEVAPVAEPEATPDTVTLAPTAADTELPQIEETPEPAVAEVEPVAEEEAEPVQVAALGPTPPLGEGSAYAPAQLLLPKARPDDLGAEMAAAVDAALASVLAEGAAPEATVAPVAEPVQTASLGAIPLPKGTRMIQLGAFDSEAVALREWDRISGRHGDLLGGKDHYVQRIESNGRIFYRLRVAGYANKQETQAACAALTARGLPCITATLR